jgi:hypothetical protein
MHAITLACRFLGSADHSSDRSTRVPFGSGDGHRVGQVTLSTGFRLESHAHLTKRSAVDHTARAKAVFLEPRS